MRDAFTRALHKLAKEDPNLILITGDLGFGVLKPFWTDYPKQFINAGIAEQAMTGMAAGIALSGKTVFTYSIGTFPTLRPLEQIRNDCAYHKANVKVVCVGGGFVYGSLGMSHHSTEDMAILRALPDVCVFTPGDPAEVDAVVPAPYKQEGACYLRLGRGGEPTIHEKPIESYRIGQLLPLVEATDETEIAILSAGGILTQAHEAAMALNAQGVKCALYSLPTLKPLDEEAIRTLAARLPHLITLEEHTVIGGLGGAVSEILAGMSGPRAQLTRMGMPDCYSCVVGDQQYLRTYYGMDAQSVVNKALSLVRS